MFSARPEDKLVIVLDEEEVINMALFAQHLPQLEFLEKFATSTDPMIVFERTKLEKYYSISASLLTQPGMSARKLLERLQVSGALPAMTNPARFEIPVLDHSEDNMLREPEAETEERKKKKRSLEISPNASANSASVSPRQTVAPPSVSPSPYAEPLSPTSVSRATATPDPEELDRRRREQQAKQAKVLAEKEKDQEQRRLIREQIEKDRLEKARQDEERKAKRALEMQQASAPNAMQGMATSAAATGLQVPSHAAHGQSTSPSISPRQHKSKSALHEPSTTTDGAISGGHWYTPTSAPPSEPASPVPGLTLKEYTQYQAILVKLEAEIPKATKMIQLLGSIRGDTSSPEKDEALAQWKKYLDAVHSDIAMVRLLLSVGPGGALKVRGPSHELPSAPVGYSLRDASKSAFEEMEEEVLVEARVLELRDGEEKWRIRVHLLEGPPVLLILNPTHTVSDLMSHIATLAANVSNRHKLEIAGQPGELAGEWTAERAGLKATTVRLVLK